MSTPATWSDQEIATIRELLERGWGYRRIAGAIGRKPSTVQSWLISKNGQLDARRVRRSRVAELLKATPWLSNAEIARQAGVSTYIVCRVRLGSGSGQRFATPAEWLDEPCGRVRALRQGHGIAP
jgi:hypothetical protein